MRAVVLKANQQMDVEDVPDMPLAADDCRIRVHNVGVCSSDIFRGCGNGAYSYPLVMGHELAGEVIAAGSRIKDFHEGDRTVIFPLLPCFKCASCKREMYAQCRDYDYYGSRRNGGYAEHLDVKAWNLLKIPDGVSFADAAAVEPLAVALHALHQTNLGADSTASICILGAGFLGLLMAQVLQKRYPQTRVTMIDRNQFKLDIAKNYVKDTECIKDASAWAAFIQKHDSEYDIVVEASGAPAMFAHALELAIAGAQVVWMSNIMGDLTLPKNLVSQVLRKELRIIGTWNSIYRPGKPDDWTDALNLIKDGLKPSALVTHWIGLKDVPEILLKLYKSKTNAEPFPLIKAMVTF